MKTLNLEVITPERILLQEAVEYITIPARKGPMGVLPGHVSFIGQLTKGRVRIDAKGTCRYFNVTSGTFEIRSDKVKILADSAELLTPASLARAEEK